MVRRRAVPFIPDYEAYRQHYGGGSFPVFRGELYQEGYGLGSLFGSLLKKVIPVLKGSVLPLVKRAGAAAGKIIINKGSRAVGDVLSGKRDIKTALETRGMEGLNDIGNMVRHEAFGEFFDNPRYSNVQSSPPNKKKRPSTGWTRKVRKKRSDKLETRGKVFGY
jgi:hypothetical protein